MIYRLLADVALILHFAFIAFVVLGGLLTLAFPRAALLHLPAAVWGVYIELRGAVCPLTPLENRLRELGGESGYSGGFIEHYLFPVIYPSGLARETQWWLAGAVIALNVVVYACVLLRARRRKV